MTQTSINWQPTLHGNLVCLRPMQEQDFEPLFLAASDPLIWEQHPENDRYKREVFLKFFRGGMDSRGAFVVLDQKNQQIIGSTRITAYNPNLSSIEIGYTFITRAYWGLGHNRELKKILLDYVFNFIENVYFVVGKNNFRSQRAMEKIGGQKLSDVSTLSYLGDLSTSVVFEIKKSQNKNLK